jgi:toxin HigB-1
VILSFKCKDTEKIWNQEFTKKIPDSLHRIAFRKLILLHRANTINDLQIPPSNRLEILKGNRKGQFSVRVNDQFRICFNWNNNNAENVEITDYH